MFAIWMRFRYLGKAFTFIIVLFAQGSNRGVTWSARPERFHSVVSSCAVFHCAVRCSLVFQLGWEAKVISMFYVVLRSAIIPTSHKFMSKHCLFNLCKRHFNGDLFQMSNILCFETVQNIVIFDTFFRVWRCWNFNWVAKYNSNRRGNWGFAVPIEITIVWRNIQLHSLSYYFSFKHGKEEKKCI
jgi:hypothetical protein